MTETSYVSIINAMKIECEKCHAVYNLKENRLPKKSKFMVRCRLCSHIMAVDFSDMNKTGQSNRVSLLSKDLLFGEGLKKEVSSNFKKLYPMPHVMLKARQILANPRSDFREVGDLVKTDQALASRILKVANSAYYGMRGQVSSIRQAAVLLGSKALVSIITILAQSKMLEGELKGYRMDAGDLWKHSLAVSVGSDIIAKEISPEYSGEAFLAGLLHDAGKILLDPYMLEREEACAEWSRDIRLSPIVIERKVLGLDHAVISSDLCINWNLPDFVGEAIRCHHEPSSSKANLLAYVIHAADTIAHKTLSGTAGTARDVDGDNALKFLRLDEKALEKLMRKISYNVEALEEATY